MPDDFSAILDVASVPDTPSPEPVSTPEPTPEVTSEPSPQPESSTPEAPTSEGTETPDQPVPEAEPNVDGRTNPAAIRSALKNFRDSAPENAPLARELNDGYGRYLAYKQAFPTVAEARNVKAFIDANGGVEGLTSLHETIKSVNDTDQLLYSGDPRVLDSIIEDMRAENKLDALTKLAGPYLEKLRGIDEKGYFEAVRPHFYQGLVDTGVPNVVQQLAKYLSGDKPDIESARGLLSNLSGWLDNLRDSVERSDKSKLDPERQAFQKEVEDFRTNQQKEFQSGIAQAGDTYANQSLGKALNPFLKLPFFKELVKNRASMTSLARELKQTLLDELGGDKVYQAQMKAFFNGKNPDKGKISSYHNAKVDSISQRIVKSVIETRYPNYASRGAATPRPGAPKPGTPASTPAPSPAGGKPEYVKAKPAWDAIDWEKDPQKMLFITGKAYLKNGKFVTWGKQKS